jgi:hypothetical protein
MPSAISSRLYSIAGDNVVYAQPQTRTQRIAVANDYIQRLHVSLPLAIDDMDNRANLLYAEWPERIYVIDEAGRIVYRGGLGPFGYHPGEARAWLASRFGSPSRASGERHD